MTKKSNARLVRDEKEKLPPREKSVIDAEYATYCGMLGDKDYRLELLKNEMVQLRNKLFELNLEANELSESQKTEPTVTESVNTETTTDATA